MVSDECRGFGGDGNSNGGKYLVGRLERMMGKGGGCLVATMVETFGQQCPKFNHFTTIFERENPKIEYGLGYIRN
jgi:hypothetical protein